ncbi:hypothetical protein HHI36_012211 [Cryptolaemus montrouzieri]|uniref:Serpin domain-containing protein n=1 Tax=Cryptolaemus montrouzieri TaxID=559131 RepID=A0ABD2NDZ6_9CUCU
MRFFYIFLLVSAVSCGKIPKEYARAMNELAVDLCKEFMGQRNNVVYSPYSLETILGLLTIGAKGDTADELKKLLQLRSPDETLKSEFKFMQTEINGLDDVTMTSANKIYLGENFKIESDFLKTATEDFDAGVQNIDFKNTKDAVNEINSWVGNKTHNKIQNLLSEDKLDDDTRMVLVNAFYFKGEWQHPFKVLDTEKKNFHISKNETVKVDTMKVTATMFVHHVHEHKVTFLRLPYRGGNGKIFLTIVLSHDIDVLHHMQAHLKRTIPKFNFTAEHMTVYLPKFRVEANLDLKPTLKKMGITKLFSTPNLSGITKESVAVDAVTQKVFINVDEQGTEAAAATAAEAVPCSDDLPDPTIPVYKVDRPFFFCLQYDDLPIITGSITDPSKA